MICSKCMSDILVLFLVIVAPPTLNTLSTDALLGSGVLYLMKTCEQNTNV